MTMIPTGNEPWYSPYDSPESYEVARLEKERQAKIQAAAQELARRIWNRELEECTPAWQVAILDDAEAILYAAANIEVTTI